jgi:flagellar protein FlgJ
MASSPLDAQAGATLNGLAADSRSLDQLRRAATADPAKAVKQVATQFEALFMQMVLKSMREATPKSGMLDSNEQQTYTSMLDEQLAQKIAAGGTGLADVIARQLSRNLPGAAGAGASETAAAAGPSPVVSGAVPGATNRITPRAPAAAGGSAAATPRAPGAATRPTAAAADAAAPDNVLRNLHAAAAVRRTP